MSLLKASSVSVATVSLLLGGIVVLRRQKTRKDHYWTSENGRAFACQDYAEDKLRMFLPNNENAVFGGIFHQTAYYIRNICQDTQLLYPSYPSGAHQFTKAYNQTMARLLAFERKPTPIL